MTDSRNKYVPRVGERVRVVLEDKVGGAYRDWFWLQSGGRTLGIFPEAQYVVSVDPIEPPVEVFGPGDTVRYRGGGSLYSIGDGGYFAHLTGKWQPSDFLFTSKHYERVILP